MGQLAESSFATTRHLTVLRRRPAPSLASLRKIVPSLLVHENPTASALPHPPVPGSLLMADSDCLMRQHPAGRNRLLAGAIVGRRGGPQSRANYRLSKPCTDCRGV